MAAITWKNVEGLNSSASDAYKVFSDMLDKAGKSVIDGLSQFQDVRKEQAVVRANALLNQFTDSKALNDPNNVNKVLGQIPPELITPALMAQIEGRKRSLQTDEKFNAEIASNLLQDNLTKAQIAASEDSIKTSALNRELTRKELNNYDRVIQSTLDTEKMGRDKTLQDIAESKAGIDIAVKELGLKQSEFGLKKDEFEYKQNLEKLDAEDKNNLANVANFINQTKDYNTAMKAVDSAKLTPQAKMLALESVKARFPQTHEANTRTDEALASLTGMVNDTKSFASLGSLRIKNSDGSTGTFEKAGVKDFNSIPLKGGVHFNGGQVAEGTVNAARLIQNTLGDRLTRFNGFNDQWHKKNSPNSKHTLGESGDYIIKGNLDDYAKAAQDSRDALKAKGLEEGKDFTVSDEANFPSSNATKEHIHLVVTKSGASKLNKAAKEESDAIAAQPSAEELVKEVNIINKNVPITGALVDQYLNSSKAYAGIKEIKVGKDEDPNDPQALGRAIAASKRLPPETAISIGNDIQQTFKEKNSEGISVTMNQVAAAYDGAVTNHGGGFYNWLSNWGTGYTDGALNKGEVDRALNYVQSTDGIKAKEFITSKEKEVNDYKSSVDTLNTLQESLRQQVQSKALGASNQEAIDKLTSAIAAKVKDVKLKEDKIRTLIEKFNKQEAARKRQELESNPASENYSAP